MLPQVLQAVAGYRGLKNKYAVAETIYIVTEKLFFPGGDRSSACDDS